MIQKDGIPKMGVFLLTGMERGFDGLKRIGTDSYERVLDSKIS